MENNYKLTAQDIAAISTLWLALLNLGYYIQNLDLTDPSFIEQSGPHTIYHFSVLVSPDQDFPQEEFANLFNAYTSISPVFKPACFNFEEHNFSANFCFNNIEGRGNNVPRGAFKVIFISIYM